MTLAKSYLTHMGTAIPEYAFNQSELLDIFLNHGHLAHKEQEKLKKIYNASMIDKRHFVINFKDDIEHYVSLSFPISKRMLWFEQYASALGIKAIKNSKLTPQELQTVTHLITVSCTGMYAPGIDIEIIKACNIPSTIARTCIYFMGCAAMINAFKTADAICKSNENAKVLIISVELCSLHFQAQNKDDDMIANALFSDGAACALIQAKPVPGKNLRLENFYSNIISNSTSHMAWSIRDEGFMITLSAFIPQLLSLGLQHLIAPIMEFYKIKLEDIDYFAIHPGGPKILQRIEDILNLAAEKNAVAYHILRNYGNMSSATILFILQRLLLTVPENKNGNILSMAFGPGLVVESALLEIHNA